MSTDEKIAVGVALVVVGALFISFFPAFAAYEEKQSMQASATAPSLNVLP